GASAGTARRVAERVQYAVLERGWQTGVPRLSCSIGVVSGPERFADWESMVAHVEGAMRSTRMAGRDRLVVT
ncbi:MAG TPA: hypothetical protein VFS42_03755, partial [Burkholderiaceae bacterium]|nr:hypothetical protein [Burkholderiaceae bacterium]